MDTADSAIAIETSTREGSVAAVVGGKLVLEIFFSAQRSHNSQVFAPLREVLASVSGSPGRIVVGTGPGSYTGARVGIAVAQGISMVSGATVVGVSSILAADIREPSYTICGDARRGTYFIARVEGRKLVGPPELCGKERLGEEAGEHLLITFDPVPPLEGVTLVRPRAALLVEAAMGMPSPGAGQVVEPYYLGAPFITEPKPR